MHPQHAVVYWIEANGESLNFSLPQETLGEIGEPFTQDLSWPAIREPD